MAVKWDSGHANPVLSLAVSKERVIASGAESGELTIWSEQGTPIGRLHLKGNDDVTGVAFSPVSFCKLYVILWNVQKARPLWLTNLQHLAQDEEDLDLHQSPGQLFNPPLAHSLAVSSCGNVFCCGAEDGKIRSFRITGTRFEEEACFKAHSQGVSQVSFMAQDPGQTLLISGGNDGRVCLWSLGKDPVQPQKTQKHHAPKKSASKAKQEASPKVSSRLCIEHGEKVNWILGAELQGSKAVLVADPSNVISVYQLGEL
ncbi:hypothetical protein GDO78_018454 [Eleutherodactylus coqui]|uniref:WD repeat-containing protein 53 n=1 Tax=Eleutherodactylus coqui TaxID=57060 RepID=A0A8J6B787_ELECQ|nr:hypothetical protein GDO78_018454 [Eleutherodactylus coqui]